LFEKLSERRKLFIEIKRENFRPEARLFIGMNN